MTHGADWADTWTETDVAGDMDGGDGGGARVLMVGGVLGHSEVNGGVEQVAEMIVNLLVYSRWRGNDGVGGRRG